MGLVILHVFRAILLLQASIHCLEPSEVSYFSFGGEEFKNQPQISLKNHKSQAEGDRLLKSSGNKMVLYFVVFVTFKFIDEVIQRSVDSKAVI